LLRLDREGHGVLFGHPVARPQALKQIKPEVSPQRFLDHLAVSLTGSRSHDLHGPQDILVNGERSSHLRHIGILASRCVPGRCRGLNNLATVIVEIGDIDVVELQLGAPVSASRYADHMCVGCAMAAASAASGFRTWLQTHNLGWLTPRRMRAATIGAMCAAGLVSTVGVSGSTPPTPHTAAAPAQHATATR
jgi:hypothetical protein